MTSIVRASFVALVLPALAADASAQSIDTTVYHRLSTEFRGSDMALDVFNGGPRNNMTHLARRQDVSGQLWRLAKVGGDVYRLHTKFRGHGMCLDIFNGGANNDEPHLARCEDVSGQSWHIKPDGNWFRLTTRFRGAGQCLDIYNGGAKDGQPHLAPCGKKSGQMWMISPTTITVQGVTTLD